MMYKKGDRVQKNDGIKGTVTLVTERTKEAKKIYTLFGFVVATRYYKRPTGKMAHIDIKWDDGTESLTWANWSGLERVKE